MSALAEEPDFILYDAHTPTLDAIEFLNKYHGSGGRSLVIVMTAYGSNELALKVMKRGAYDYLAKPFTGYGHCNNLVRKKIGSICCF